MTLNFEVADSQPALCHSAAARCADTGLCRADYSVVHTFLDNICATPGERALLPLFELSQVEVSLAKEAMSEARIPRKHKGEVLSQSSEHAKAVRRQPKRRAGIKGRREYDVQAERGQQNVSVAMLVRKFRLFRCTLHWQSAHTSASAILCMAH